MDFVAYEAFKKSREKDFESIASRTHGALEVEDLHTEAWLAAEYHAVKRGCPIDWRDPQDQKLILSILTVTHVWRPRKDRKRTLSADAFKEDHEGNGISLIDLLDAKEAPDPLELLEKREDEEKERIQRAQEDALLETYSQSVAYNVALWHFDNICSKLAAYLAIDHGTLRHRIESAAKLLKVQPSLFDRIERITSSFWPRQGRVLIRPIAQHLVGSQWRWDF
ncbi:hypothetical protein [Noviherbaspirillum sp.]|uniref:hypothetical protein n=1 Tax=Noviherbaspirillum sp. TaxID=1926288 RepID=UPI002B479D53|nr:hypothetical protein [Noviherbaspirillum sp.]HJV82290.1 hypothetical protein [Noviherbaspirillum sp.]